MSGTNWKSIEYLKTGNIQQRDCYKLLCEIKIFEHLEIFHPILSGTIPIGVDLPDSDLDIICETQDLTAFRDTVRRLYSRFSGFTDRLDSHRYVADFSCRSQIIEIYATPQPSVEQFAYRHMIVEYRLLRLLGKSFRNKIIQLKSQGYKTEPAFGKVLGISGDPYQMLLELEAISDSELLKRFG